MSRSIRSSRSPARRAPARRRSSTPSTRSSAARASTAASIEGDAFHRYDRAGDEGGDRRDGRGAGDTHLQPFRVRGQPARRARASRSASYGETGHGPDAPLRPRRRARRSATASPPGTFTRLGAISEDDSDLLFYEGLHGAVVNEQRQPRAATPTSRSASCRSSTSNGSRRSTATAPARGYSTEAVTDTILRRMPHYVHYICPQFTETDINFQRVPMVDTSNPFIARWIPTAGRIDGRHPLPQPARHRLPLPGLDDPRQLDDAAPTRSSSPATSSTSRCS